MSELTGLTLLKTDGAVIELSELWAERPVLITWLRHYG